MNKESLIYVAGHRGMVGSAIVRRLIKGGYQHIITRTSAELDLRNQSDVNQFFKTEKPEYVFLDNSLPDGMGWGKTEFILANYPLTHLNLVSALDVPKTSASTFRILEKPVSINEILACLN